ncbi:MAG TPA: Crp/Fnr family transcriptional regulator [Candidatus Eisenbacteria bacterium]|nr:Crp/Fnr family transcriptional regulator [Candidatus Eisenbacteria bacterium]
MLTPVERVLILKGADLLRGVGPRHLLGLANVSREVPIYAGDTIYLETDPADALYIVVEGRVRISTAGRATSEVGPGEAFGTWSLIDDSERGQQAECIEDGLALSLSREEFYDVASADLAILQELVRVLAKRLRELAATAPPEEARVEGEGIEKTEAQVEAARPTESPAEAVGPTSSPGSSLAAAAAGKATTSETPLTAPNLPGPTDGTAALDPVIAPEPIVPPTESVETEE